MARVLTQCPRVTSPCPQVPTFARGEKSVFCDLCRKRVHNLSAMSARERETLLSGGGPLCVRYAVLLPAAALLLASQSALPQDTADGDTEELDSVVIVGGGVAGVNDLVFLESEESDDAWMDESGRTRAE